MDTVHPSMFQHAGNENFDERACAGFAFYPPNKLIRTIPTGATAQITSVGSRQWCRTAISLLDAGVGLRFANALRVASAGRRMCAAI